MSKNFYVVGDESLTKFIRADGNWTEDRDEAEHLSLDQAVARQVECIRRGVITEIFEVPLLAEGMYDAIHARIDELQELLADRGISLTTHIGEGDETTWTFEISGLTLDVKLAGPDDWEITTDED